MQNPVRRLDLRNSLDVVKVAAIIDARHLAWQVGLASFELLMHARIQLFAKPRTETTGVR